jgi:transcriptional regulator with XRE-family HTH domain
MESPLRLARERERFTLRQLAEVTGINHRRIHAIETGARPSPIEARILSAALRVSPVALFGLEVGLRAS